MKHIILTVAICLSVMTCKNTSNQEQTQGKVEETTTSSTPFVWEGANLYFLLTDRFNNGDTTTSFYLPEFTSIATSASVSSMIMAPPLFK